MTVNAIANEVNEKIQAYRQQQFTGVVKVSSPTGCHWHIYCLLGRIVWVQSRVHPVRRWRRHLARHSPAFFEEIIQQSANPARDDWSYAALARSVRLNQFPRDEFSDIVKCCIAEDLFDILQVGTLQYRQSGRTLIYQSFEQKSAALPFILLQQELAWQLAREEWQAWQQAGLTKLSPDWAPKIHQPNALKAQIPSITFQTLTAFVDGKTPLRDLAVQFSQPVIPLTKSILPYLSNNIIGFAEIPDISTAETRDTCLLQLGEFAGDRPAAALPSLELSGDRPLSQQPSQSSPLVTNNPTPSRTTRKVKNSADRIIYIDDSPADSRTMSDIVESMGYQYTNIHNPLQALPLLIELKPKLIFLDLVMPIANGYEICAQIRRVSALKTTPIIIVTSNDGVASRIKTKIAGASGFLGKPIKHDKVLKVVKKHLRHFASSH